MTTILLSIIRVIRCFSSLIGINFISFFSSRDIYLSRETREYQEIWQYVSVIPCRNLSSYNFEIKNAFKVGVNVRNKHSTGLKRNTVVCELLLIAGSVTAKVKYMEKIRNLQGLKVACRYSRIVGLPDNVS